MILPSAFASLVEEEMNQQFAQYTLHGSSEALHRQRMNGFRRERVFGCLSPTDPWLFHIDACFLCQAESGVPD